MVTVLVKETGQKWCPCWRFVRDGKLCKHLMALRHLELLGPYVQFTGQSVQISHVFTIPNVAR
jgi:hypothetical protein